MTTDAISHLHPPLHKETCPDGPPRHTLTPVKVPPPGLQAENRGALKPPSAGPDFFSLGRWHKAPNHSDRHCHCCRP